MPGKVKNTPQQLKKIKKARKFKTKQEKKQKKLDKENELKKPCDSCTSFVNRFKVCGEAEFSQWYTQFVFAAEEYLNNMTNPKKNKKVAVPTVNFYYRAEQNQIYNSEMKNFDGLMNDLKVKPTRTNRCWLYTDKIEKKQVLVYHNYCDSCASINLIPGSKKNVEKKENQKQQDLDDDDSKENEPEISEKAKYCAVCNKHNHMTKQRAFSINPTPKSNKK